MRDNWIYIQEPDVLVGRLQIFNNWSPYMVADPTKVWIGLEYFCNEGDELWTLPDDELIELANDELARIGIIDPADGARRHRASACRRPTPPTSAPTTASTSCAASSTASRTSSSSAATACTATTTRTTRC